ncbi:MAG: DUF1697 domain-containing protein [Candidatus Thorarchaeota archaeon]
MAFLRGINVGGRNILKMQEVRRGFVDLGFSDVSSFKASGNILFETEDRPEKVTQLISERLCEISGRDIGVFLRSSKQIVELLEVAPFEGRQADASKLYVTFLPSKYSPSNAMQMWSKNRDVEIIKVTESEVYSQTFLYKGRYGAPNKFIEDQLDISATTRNWNTVKGVHEKLIQS